MITRSLFVNFKCLELALTGFHTRGALGFPLSKLSFPPQEFQAKVLYIGRTWE